MKIIIVGAGEVGYNIAGRLASENKQVIVIDKNPDAVRRLSENLDIQVITASGSNPKVLIDAGINETDILLAVTDQDETNLVACLITDLISPTTKKLVRLRDADFDSYHERFKKEAPHIDTVINPEIEVVNTIRKLMEVPGAVDVGDFVDGQVKYIGIRLDKNSPMAGIRLIDFPAEFGEERPLIAAIIRGNKVIVPRGGNKLEPGDLVYFVCETIKLEKTLKLFGKKIQPIQNALIIGGGRIGERLAKRLEQDNIKTKIIESDINRCHYLSEQMDKTVVLHGDGSDQKLFLEENAGQSDVVVSVTDDDETNILVSLLAKNLGVQNTITRIGKSSYSPLLATIGLEKVVNPRLSAVSSILQNVRKGKVLSDISIFGERGEFIEAIALETSDITNKPLKKISFPKGALLVCIIREGQIMIPAGDSSVKPGDRIIMFAVKHAVKKLEKLLTVKLDFF
ncbi:MULTISPECIES: Trk system potassium transporter TrkA [Desulfobacula]|uniref:Trk system potassium uptake protein TrkA n=2 Tax=Desulfobacula TaxID=28222 RepID=K0N9C9_DESTT|nr:MULTISPECIES: Trk system potassium transporter TrkA [Desulfobacula]CCK80534.1 TrkA3: Trk system potassium NAD-binding peripheral membrane protein [Desulfobacula toluolica Tol2]SDT96060.1 trk system potassium uptake protein TrkA [Desulfobacula phenolica]